MTIHRAAVNLARVAQVAIVVVHRTDGEFYHLGNLVGPDADSRGISTFGTWMPHVTHEAPPAAVFDALPVHDCQGCDAAGVEWCVILDALTVYGDVVTDKQVSREVADALLDGTLDLRLDLVRSARPGWYARQAAARRR